MSPSATDLAARALPSRRVYTALSALVPIAALLWCAPAQAKPERPRGKIVVEGDFEFPPYSYLDGNGRPAGFAVDMLEAAAAHVDLDVQLRLVPLAAALADLEQERIDAIVGIQTSAERALSMDFSVPYAVVHHALFVGRESGIDSLEAAGHGDILAERGSVSEEYLTRIAHKGRIIAVQTPVAALRLVASGKFESALLPRHVGLYLINEYGIEGVFMVDGPVTTADYGFAVRAGEPVLRALNEGLATLKGTGEYTEIYDRWFGAYKDGDSVPVRSILRYAAFLLIPLLLVVLLALIWNWSLRQQVRRATSELRTELAERKRTEEERRGLEDQLRQAQKLEAIGQLAGGLAHDFNNVLVGVSGFAELVRRNGMPRDQVVDAMEQILRATRRGSDLIKRLLAFARKGRAREVPVDINRTLSDTIALLSHSIDRRIEIKTELDFDAPRVIGDPAQLENALLNLGLNARDAMPDGGTLTFATRRRRMSEAACRAHPDALAPGDYVEVKVSDTGMGMSEDTVAHIFEPFFTTKEAGVGTGLGLASVYGYVVKSHQGSIDVASAVGEGTTFTLLFPAGDSSTSERSNTDQYRALPIGEGHVLVVDDEQLIRDFTEQALKGLGYRVTTCCDGADALEWARGQDRLRDVDLVLLDVVMPRLGGLETFRALRRKRPDLKVVLTSGFSRDNVAAECLAGGAVAFLPKPFTLEELADLVSRHVGQGRDTGGTTAAGVG